jgi:hypothetical protein
LEKPEQKFCAIVACNNGPSYYWSATDKWYCGSCAGDIEEELLGVKGLSLFYWGKFERLKPFDYERFDACD